MEIGPPSPRWFLLQFWNFCFIISKNIVRLFAEIENGIWKNGAKKANGVEFRKRKKSIFIGHFRSYMYLLKHYNINVYAKQCLWVAVPRHHIRICCIHFVSVSYTLIQCGLVYTYSTRCSQSTSNVTFAVYCTLSLCVCMCVLCLNGFCNTFRLTALTHTNAPKNSIRLYSRGGAELYAHYVRYFPFASVSLYHTFVCILLLFFVSFCHAVFFLTKFSSNQIGFSRMHVWIKW